MTSSKVCCKLSWREVSELLERLDIDHPGTKVYGVPTGGMILTHCLKKATVVLTPEEANVILDDIIDSGKTRQWFAKYHPKPFFALIDKTGDPDVAGMWYEFPWETQYRKMTDTSVGPVDAVVRLLQWIGEEVHRDGLKDTPKRVVKSLKEMTAGYEQSAEKVLGTVFKQDYDEMIISSGIRFSSLCEHHLLPFMGTAVIGYLPNESRVVGLSKLSRVVNVFSKRLQIQERMTQQIAEAVMNHPKLLPAGVGVILRAHHTCMGCRGVNQPEAEMVTSCLLGVMRTSPAVRSEFLTLASRE